MKVVYLVNETGIRVTKTFDSPYLCQKFVNKLKRSRKCTLVSFPIFG